MLKLNFNFSSKVTGV